MHHLEAHHKIILHLTLIHGIGPSAINTIVDVCKANDWPLSRIYSLSAQALREQFALSEKQAQLVRSGLLETDLVKQEIVLVKKYNITLVTMLDDGYPPLLRHISTPPSLLYWQGELLPADEKLLSVVGSRKAGDYAQKAIGAIVPGLVEHGWCIVSGGALGVDSMAHHSTLASGGKTVCIQGAGLLRLYPRSNRALFDKILDSGGALVSAFPLTMDASRNTFPARNRIISGMSQGCFVVQAALRSGAQITANYALEQGRELFALPGSVHDPLSAGCHALITQGARLVNGVDDILSEFGESYRKVVATQPAVKDVVSNSIIQVCNQPVHFDQLQEQMGLSTSDLHQKLFDLSIQGLIHQNYLGLWVVQ